MDFISRAGSYIDRAHRIAGLLLICCVVLMVLVMCQANTNSQLQAEYSRYRQALPVIVVPGSVAGKYSPTEDALLVSAFVDFITQMFNTYTPANLAGQLQSARQFFAPTLLVDSEPFFQKKLNDAETLNMSSLFVPDRNSLLVRSFVRNNVGFREVKLRGTLQTGAAGTIVESFPVEIAMTLQKTIVNPELNRFGFQLVTYQERRITPAEEREPLIDTSGPTGQ